MLRGFVLFTSGNLNHSGIFMYISLSMDPYKYVIKTFMRRISNHYGTAKLIKKLYVIASMTRENVSSLSIPGFCEKLYATNYTLYLMISLFPLRFRTNTHLYPTGFTSLGVLTTSPKTSHFVDNFNFACITSFHFGQSFLCWHSSTFRGSRSSSFLMEATWKVKIILFWSYFSPVYT